jgi:hypothetical protein
MATTSRRLSAKGKTSKPSHTPGKTKGGFCVRHPDAHIAISANPYKGEGLKGNKKASYNRWWARMLAVNGGKKV